MESEEARIESRAHLRQLMRPNCNWKGNWATTPTRAEVEKPRVRCGGAGGARTHDRQIMSPLL
jgi:hypothetical protein